MCLSRWQHYTKFIGKSWETDILWCCSQFLKEKKSVELKLCLASPISFQKRALNSPWTPVLLSILPVCVCVTVLQLYQPVLKTHWPARRKPHCRPLEPRRPPCRLSHGTHTNWRRLWKQRYRTPTEYSAPQRVCTFTGFTLCYVSNYALSRNDLLSTVDPVSWQWRCTVEGKKGVKSDELPFFYSMVQQNQNCNLYSQVRKKSCMCSYNWTVLILMSWR